MLPVAHSLLYRRAVPGAHWVVRCLDNRNYFVWFTGDVPHCTQCGMNLAELFGFRVV